MRPAAEVDEFALFIETDLLVPEVLEQFQLIGFTLALEKIHRLLPGDLPAAERQVLLDQLLHPGLDALKVLGGKGLGRVEIVIEAGLDGRADGDLDAGEEGPDGFGHDMGGAVAHDVQALGRFLGNGRDRAVGLEGGAEIHQAAVDVGRHHVMVAAHAHLLQGFGHAEPGFDGVGRMTRDMYLNYCHISKFS